MSQGFKKLQRLQVLLRAGFFPSHPLHLVVVFCFIVRALYLFLTTVHLFLNVRTDVFWSELVRDVLFNFEELVVGGNTQILRQVLDQFGVSFLWQVEPGREEVFKGLALKSLAKCQPVEALNYGNLDSKLLVHFFEQTQGIFFFEEFFVGLHHFQQLLSPVKPYW